MVKFYRVRRDRQPAITRRRQAITARISVAATGLIARERPADHRPGRRRPWAWFSAAILHALVIALLLISWRARPPALSESPPGVSVVFDNGGQQQAAAPPAPVQAPSVAAQTPPPSALTQPPAPTPAVPPQVAAAQPEVNLNLPEEMQLPTPPAPQLQPLPMPSPAPRPTRPRAAPRQKYLVMNNMSLGGGPAAPATHFPHGMNLALPQSSSPDSQQVTVHGDVGADWGAELDRWVDAHKYYPQAAAEQGQQGDVRIHFTVDRAGNVTGLRLTDSSGSVFLDQAWLGLFQGAQLPSFPAGTKADKVTIDATMHFVIIQ